MEFPKSSIYESSCNLIGKYHMLFSSRRKKCEPCIEVSKICYKRIKTRYLYKSYDRIPAEKTSTRNQVLLLCLVNIRISCLAWWQDIWDWLDFDRLTQLASKVYEAVWSSWQVQINFPLMDLQEIKLKTAFHSR